ncbi:MAG: alpha/beta hydrolase family protein [Nakamurella sp.]
MTNPMRSASSRWMIFLCGVALLATSCTEAGSQQSAGPASSSASVVNTVAGPSGSVAATAPGPSVVAASTLSAAQRYDCLSKTEQQRNFHQLTVNGQPIDSVEFGTGTVGILLSHQSDGDLCQWLGYALPLVARGYRVIVPSYGSSGQLDVALAAIARLKSLGATAFVLIGASMGGTISLATAAKMKPAPRAVVSLSGPTEYGSLDVGTTVAALSMPLFFAAGAFDTSFAEDARLLDKAATGSKHRELLVVPGSSDHGMELLAGTVVTAPMEKFLATYAPAR